MLRGQGYDPKWDFVKMNTKLSKKQTVEIKHMYLHQNM